MFSPHRRQRRIGSLVPVLLLATILMTGLLPVFESTAQVDSLDLQANPTEEPDPPIRVNPTEVPPRETEAPDVIQANPTAEPTAVPTEELPLAIADPATVTMSKGVCDDAGFDAYNAVGLDAFLDACMAPDGEFEFNVANGAGFSETNFTSLGSVQFEVPAGNIVITETIPAGWDDPAVFCWSDLFPAPAAQPFIGNGPSWDVAEGEQVECSWFNITLPVDDGNDHTVLVSKAVCPEGVSLAEDYWTLANSCTERMEGVGFSLETEGGTVVAETDANGEIEWTGVDLGASGQISMDEDIPEGYGEPAVWCVSFPQEAADAQDFDFFAAPSVDGSVTVSPEQTAPYIFSCAYFNQADGSEGPGELADPSQQGAGEGGVNVIFIKHHCPLGVPEDSTLDQYVVICAELMSGVSLTMEHEGGSFPVETGEDGQAEWSGVPTGDIVEITEDIPEGYKNPLAFCAMFDGEHELQSGQEQSNGGVVPLVIPEDATDIACHLFNIQDPALFEPEPESRVLVNKRICDPDVDLVLTAANTIDTIINACPTEGNGIEFTLDHADGSSTQAIENGATFWDGVPNGPITITEHIPGGYGEPVWFCGSNLLDQAGDIDVNGMVSPALAPGGVLSATLDEEFGEIFFCWAFNVPGDDAALTMMKWTCPAGYDVHAPGADPEADCPDATNGIPFQFGQPGLGNVAELQETGDVIDGGVRFTHLEPGNWKLVELAPDWVESAFVGSCTVNGNPWPGGVPLNEGFELEMDLGASQSILCHMYNVPKDGNSLLVNKFLCPLTFDVDVDDKATECTESFEGVTFTLGDLEATTDDQGVATFDDVANGDYTLTEVLPDGVSAAHVGGCTVNGMPALIAVLLSDPPSVPFGLYGGEHWECTWYNEQEEPEDNSVGIRKWQCPEGTDPNQPQAWFEANCLAQHDGVLFSVASDIGVAAAPTVGGAVDFPGLPAGQVGIQEHIPDGFGPPVVFCNVDGDWQEYPAPTGHWDYDFPADGESETLICHVYNILGGDGDITLLKWTCPPGYDLFAAGADPEVDCTEATDGVQFQFGLDDGIEALAELQTTGDVIPGGVFFGDLEPDVYKAVELVPDGIEQVFVLKCTGHIMGMLQPYPLSMGNVLNGIDLDAGEHLVCHWYNVPDDEPGDGSLTVIKYTCSTETFISEVDCQIYEDGKTFDLLLWNTVSGEWDVADTQVTDGVGRIDWPSIAPGDYRLDEHDGDWCHLETQPVFGPGDGFSVFEDDETVVHVYNCDGTPGERGDIPNKYPNTGVPPTSGGSGAATELPALGGLLGLAITRRRLVAGIGLPLAGTSVLGRAMLAQDAEQVIEPQDGTPVAGTPASLCLSGEGETCERGAVPAGIRIEAIGVDAPVEILETVQGVMQQPSDEVHVAWYKESARIGEIGNILFAAHVNWWGFPEAVFFNLGTLQEGDLVEVIDEEETVATYSVEWVTQESNLEPPREEVLGMTEYEAVTLMTCSGEWNSEISEYDSRTVVRARRVEDDATPAA